MIEMKHINLSFRDKDLFTDQEIKIDSGKITLITGESGSVNRLYYLNLHDLQIMQIRNIFMKMKKCLI